MLVLHWPVCLFIAQRSESCHLDGSDPTRGRGSHRLGQNGPPLPDQLDPLRKCAVNPTIGELADDNPPPAMTSAVPTRPL
jgi:hypothetical protein